MRSRSSLDGVDRSGQGRKAVIGDVGLWRTAHADWLLGDIAIRSKGALLEYDVRRALAGAAWVKLSTASRAPQVAVVA